MPKIQVKRGNKAGLPSLAAGEFGLVLDTPELYIGGQEKNLQVPLLDDNGKVPSGQLPEMSGDYIKAGGITEASDNIILAMPTDSAAFTVKGQSGSKQIDFTPASIVYRNNDGNPHGVIHYSNGVFAVNGRNIRGLAAPTESNDAATKGYVDEKRKLFTATLSTSWSGSGPYTQTVSISGITSDMAPVVDVVLSSSSSTAKNQLAAWGCVGKIVTNNGSITATCYDEKPTTSIPIQLLVVQ